MTRPPARLIDLIAGRGFRGPIDDRLVGAAIEHKVHALLKSWVDRNGLHPESQPLMALEAADLATWARNQVLRKATLEIFAIAQNLEIDLAVIKGLATEQRWYDRFGERPSWDIDLLLAPWHLPRTAELVAALQPEHSMLPFLSEAIKTRAVQSIDLGFAGLPVDLHLDPLKLEIASTRFPESLWEGSFWLDLDESNRIRVLSSEATYLLAALHLNKDRFRYLLGYSDMLRIGSSDDLEIDRIFALARHEGIGTSFQATEWVVRSDLGLPNRAVRKVWQARIWTWVWPRRTRLLGSEGRVRFRYRQFLIPAFDPGRWTELVAGWFRRIFPPRWSVERVYPGTRGPYWLRLLVGRFRIRVRRRHQRRRAPIGPTGP